MTRLPMKPKKITDSKVFRGDDSEVEMPEDDEDVKPSRLHNIDK